MGARYSARVSSLRLMVYDRTCRGRGPLPGLSHAWWAGAKLYGALGRLDATRGVASWPEALSWLATFEPASEIAEIQFWGHGKWGHALVDGEPLDERALLSTHPWNADLAAVRARLSPDALWWFRTCETFGAHAGASFAKAWTDFFTSRAAGHTYIIGYWQSGLHSLAPGQEPSWAPDEGIVEGDASRPTRAAWSKPGAPNTITCLEGTVPTGY